MNLPVARMEQLLPGRRSDAAHVRWSDGGVSHAVFAIEGMRCSACSNAISRALGKLPGVERVCVNVATGRASVDWDPQQVTLARILDVVTATGFKPTPLAGETAASGQRAERRSALKRIGLAGLGMMQAMMFVYCIYAVGAHGIDPVIAQYLKLAGLLITTPVLVYSGAPFFAGALRDLRRGTLGMDVPVALALALGYTASAINTLRGVGEIYFDSVTMFIFFLSAGRFVEMTVRQRSLSATEALAHSLPATVIRIAADGSNERIAPQRVRAGEHLWIPRGAVIPVDALPADGPALVDESLLTGESTPVEKRSDQLLLGGSINLGHPLRVIAKGRVAQSMLANIVGLLERTQAQRPAVARAADRMASWFVLSIVTLAVAVAVFWLWVEPARALPAALAVLVVTCPCALSLATPAAIAAATARLARSGLLVTRADALERLADVDVVMIDKTGTLTRGTPELAFQDCGPGQTREDLLQIAAALEAASEHPIALAFRPHLTRERVAGNLQEFAGRGVEGVIEGKRWRLGSPRFVAELTTSPPARALSPTGDPAIVLGNSDSVMATFALIDALRPDALHAVDEFRGMGLQVAIASGDQDQVVQSVAGQLGIQDATGRLSPRQKLIQLQQRQRAGARVLMIGDGINDGPVLAAASVSCAMAQGSAVAQAAADLLLLNESLTTLTESVRTARRMRTVIRQNLGWALAYNLAAVPLAALGWIPPWVAAIGMSVSSLLVVLNAARLANRGTDSRT